MKARNLVIPSLAVAGGGVLFAGAAAAALYKLATQKTRVRMQGKVVLITGGSRGLGLAMAEEFGRRGARLVLAARSPGDLQRAKEHLVRRRAVRHAEDVLTVAADLRRVEDAGRLIDRATEHFGQVDVLVNNAGVITVGPLENQRPSDFRDVMDSNFFSGVYCTLAVLPQMLSRRDGTIVNIASIGGKVAVPHMLPYTASKFAAVGFSQGLHAELRAKGIHVLTVCPGLMRTGSHVAARFTGNQASEYRWFSMSANMPGASTSAAHAARRIVRATIAGETEIAITVQAMMLARLGQVTPEVTVRVMATMNRLLPGAAAEDGEPRRGSEVRDQEWRPAEMIGRAAAHRYNQAI